MPPKVVSETQRGLLSDFIAEKVGLHFPPERWADLERGLTEAAGEFGCADAVDCTAWVLSGSRTKAELQAFASHLTIGETYFFRERKTFEALTASVVPELMRPGRNGGQRLRIWSAGCCTGEEPYSLAILLHELIPNPADWHITILATDINNRFLKVAATGVYRDWAFRGSPPSFKERYFKPTEDGRHAILPAIRQRVTFMQLNLAEDSYPSVATHTNAMDVIFCRNVLMYFTASQVQRVLGNLRNALVEDGWLVTSPSEGAHALNSGFIPVHFPGAILHKRDPTKGPGFRPSPPASVGEAANFLAPPLGLISSPARPVPVPPPGESPLAPLQPVEKSSPAEKPPPPGAVVVAGNLYGEGQYAEAVETLLNSFTEDSPPEPPAFSLLARALANQGKLTEAKDWCDRWVTADKLDASGHYLRAVVLQELGEEEEAGHSLQRALYLRPDFVLAHFASANLARRGGRNDEANKHFANTSHLLRGCPPADLLPESDGLTAERLAEIISSVAVMEGAP